MTPRALLLVALFWSAAPLVALPQEAPRAPRPRRIDVPAAAPQRWPKFDPPLIAVPRDDFEALLEAAAPQAPTPPAVQLERARYAAALQGDSWQGGTLELSVKRFTAQPTWLRLSPWTAALRDLRWEHEAALWGADRDGRTWIHVDQPRGVLQGAWSQRGRKIAGRLEFEFELPAALATTLELTLPRQLTLTASRGLLQRRPAADAENLALWSLDLGGETSCRITVDGLSPSTPPRSLLTYQQQVVAAIREDHLHLQASLEPTMIGGSTSELRVSVPAAWDVFSVSWGGDELSNWTRAGDNGGRNILHIPLPEPLQGAGRILRIEGLIGQRPGTSVTIPQLELLDAAFRGGEHTVSVAQPMQVVGIRSTGFRPIEPRLATAESEMFKYRQLTLNGLLTFEIRRPRPLVNAQLLAQLQLDADEWRQQAEILLSCSSGAVFQAAVRLPADWEVTNVESFSADGAAESLTWDAAPDGKGNVSLTVEFLEAITLGNPRLLRIESRRRFSSPISTLELPVPRPLEMMTDAAVCIQGPAQFRAALVGGADWEPTSPERLGDAWKTLPAWSRLTEGSPGLNLWFRGALSDQLGKVVLDADASELVATAEVALLARQDGLVETCELEVQPRDGDVPQRVLVYLSESGPPLDWRIPSPQGMELVATRLPGEMHAAWGLPPLGEFWELKLPAGVGGVVRVQGQRRRPWDLPMRAALAFLPQQADFRGRVTLTRQDAPPVAAFPLGLAAEAATERGAAAAAGASRSAAWTYSAYAQELRLLRQQGAAAPHLPGEYSIALQSLIVAHQTGADHHHAALRISGNTQPIRFRAPAEAELLYARINGERVEAGAGGDVTVPASPPGEEQRLDLVYRFTQAAGFFCERRRIPLPVGEGAECTQLRWELYIPPSAQILAEPGEVRFAQALPTPPWRQRFFGPLGRELGDPMFLPWSPGNWSRLWSGSTPVTVDLQTAETALAPPSGWQSHVGYVTEPGAELSVTVWHAGRAHCLAWMILLATLACGLLVRACRWTGRARAATILATLLLAATLVSAPPWTEWIGGAIAGAIVAMLVPRRLLERAMTAPVKEPPSVPVGSTQTLAIVRGVGCLLLAGGAAAGLAQEPAGPPRDGDERGDDVFVVPVDEDRRPSRKLPVVYTTPALLARLRAVARPPESTPEWLIRAARYRAVLGIDGRADVTAEFDVLVFGPEERVTVPLLIRGRQPVLESAPTCLVDNHPAALSLQLPAGDLAATIERAAPPLSAIGAALPTVHTVVVHWRKPWQPNPGQARLDLAGPIVADAQLTIEGIPLSSDWDVLQSRGAIKAHTPSRRLVADLGPTAQFGVVWDDGRRARDERATLDIDVAEVLNVGTSVVQVRSRLAVRRQSGPVRTLTAMLPVGAAVQELRVAPAGRTRVESLEGGAQRLTIEFEEPLEALATIDCDFVVPQPQQDSDFVWSGVRCTPSNAQRIGKLQRVWAFAANAELLVTPQSLDNSQLVPVAADAAPDALRSLLAGATPQAVYQVNESAAVPFRWAIAVPKRTATSWRQTGTVEARRLRWVVEAELQASGLPVYSHVLLVDRRLQIESISVRERGAERLTRWSELRPTGNAGQNRVTLFLSDPCVETQQLTLVGSLIVPSNGAVSLPNVRCDDAETQGSELRLVSGPGLNLRWTTQKGLRIAEPGDAAERPDNLWVVCEPTEPDWRGVIQVRPDGAVTAPRMLLSVAPQTPSTRRLAVRCLWPVVAGEQPVCCRLPRGWMANPEVSAEHGRVELQQLEDGDWAATVIPHPQAVFVALQIATTVSRIEMAGAGLRLPHQETFPGDRTGEVGDVWLIEASDADGRWLLALPPELGAEEPPPDWAQSSRSALGLSAEHAARWWKLPPQLRSCPLAADVGAPRSATVEWLEHRIWMHDDGRTCGRTLIRLAGSAAQLPLSLAADLTVVWAQVDGRPALFVADERRQISLAADDGRAFSDVEISWRHFDRAAGRRSRVLDQEWVVPREQIVRSQGVTVYLPSTHWMRPIHSWAETDWTDRLLLRLELLSDTLDAAEPAAHERRVREFLSGYRCAAHKLAGYPQIFAGSRRDRAERWQNIVDRVNRLAAETQREPVADESCRIDDDLVDHPGARHGALPPEAASSMWLVLDRRWLWGLQVAGLLLLALLVLRVILYWPWGEWLSSRPNVSLALLGVVWWTCLTPSILGFALLAWSAFRIVAARSRGVRVAAPA